MEKVKTFLKERSLGFYLAILAIILAPVTIVLYKKVGVNVFSPSLNKQTIAFLIAGTIITAVSLVLSFIPQQYVKMAARPVRFAAYLCFMYAFLMFIYSQINFIANVFVAIDGNHFSGLFILTLIFYVLATVITAVSAGLDNYAPWNKKSVAEGGANE